MLIDILNCFFKDKEIMSYHNFVFSIGTDEGLYDYDQTIYPIKLGNISANNTIIFAIDSDYKLSWMDKEIRIRLNPKKNNEKSKNNVNNNKIKNNKKPTENIITLKKCDLTCITEPEFSFYRNTELNFTICFIKDNLPTFGQEYKKKTDFIYSFDRDFTKNKEINKNVYNFWTILNMRLKLLILNEKNIFINNFAFFNAFSSRDRGHYFELFPELGYLLKILYDTNKKSGKVTKLFITVFEETSEGWRKVIKHINDITDFNNSSNAASSSRSNATSSSRINYNTSRSNGASSSRSNYNNSLINNLNTINYY